MRECVVLAKTDQLDDVTSSMMEYVNLNNTIISIIEP
jgi:hypothetical protein